MNFFPHDSLFQWLLYFAISLFGAAVGLFVVDRLDKRSGQELQNRSFGAWLRNLIFYGCVLFIGFLVVIFVLENKKLDHIFTTVVPMILVIAYSLDLILRRIMKK